MSQNLFLLAGDGAFSLITPDPGLAIWTALIFLILMLLLTKFAFKPILGALKSRENSIADALASAEKAKKEMAELTANNEALLVEAREERNKILQEARELKDKEIALGKERANLEADKIIATAKAEITSQKNKAMAEVKNEAGNMAILVAEKILRKELANKSDQESLANNLINEIKLN